MTDSIHRRDINSIRDCVRMLNRLPRIALSRPVNVLLVRMPSDRSRVEEDARAAKRGQPCAFGVPLVPANQRANFSDRRIERAKAEIAGREVKLLVVSRIIGYVHLAIDAGDVAFGVDDGGAVMIKSGGSALEDRRDDGYFLFAGDFS